MAYFPLYAVLFLRKKNTNRQYSRWVNERIRYTAKEIINVENCQKYKVVEIYLISRCQLYLILKYKMNATIWYFPSRFIENELKI